MKLCRSCSQSLPDESLFCSRCGTRLNSDEPRETTGRRSIWPERFGAAVIEGEIGKGGMAVVFRARHEQLGIPVAVKAMSTSSPVGDVERFKREARVGMRLAHPGCVKVYDFGAVEPFYFMIQEFVEGEDLRERIRRRERFPWIEALTMSLEITRVIAYIHSQGVVHRDLKPANIFLPWRGGVKIGDFGLATEGGDLQIEDERLTMAGLAIGSPAYMPPEQFRDTSSVDERGDLYSLGITMFELLTGEPPFRSKKVAALRDMHLSEERPRPSDRVPGIPAPFEAIILRLVEREPLDRFQSSAELLKDLERFADSVADHGASPEAVNKIRRTTRSFRSLDEGPEEGVAESGLTLPPGYSLLHPVSEGPAWRCLLVHHTESAQDLNLWLLDRKKVPAEVPERIKSDLLRIGAANVRGLNGAIAVGDIHDEIFAAAFQNEGKSFKDQLAAEGPLPEERAVALVQDLCVTLRPLHEEGLTMRGLRPEALYIDGRGKASIDAVAAIIGDAALVLDENAKDPADHSYTSPERLGRSSVEGSVVADVFSLGAVLHRLMTNTARTAENDHSVTSTASSNGGAGEDRPRTLREVLGARCTRSVSDAVRRCLAIAPEERFPSVEEFSLALKGRATPSPSGRYEPRPVASLTSFIGLDLGASSSSAAMIEPDGSAHAILSPEGQSSRPTAVSLENGQVLIGEAAMLAGRKAPTNLHRDFLCEVTDAESSEHPVTLVMQLSKKLLSEWSSTLAQAPKELVVSTPTSWGERERHALKMGIELAGLKVLGFIPSTSAIALAYGLRPDSAPTRALILDLGRANLSVAICEIQGGDVQVLAADGLRGFGGQDWSDRLRHVVSSELQRANHASPADDPVSRAFFQEQIELTKRVFSTRPQARILIPANGKVERLMLDRVVFDEACQDLLQRIASVLESVLAKANLGWNSIDRVLAFGCASRMTSVTKLILKVTGRVPDTSLDPIDSAAIGAAYYALKIRCQAGDEFPGKPARIARKISLRNISIFSLGFVVDSGRGQSLTHILIAEQTPLPNKVTKIFHLTPDSQRRVRLRLIEGDPRATAMRTIGVVTISDVGGMGESLRIAVTVAIGEDSSIQVEAHETRSGKPYAVKFERLVSGLDKIRQGLRRAAKASREAKERKP